MSKKQLLEFNPNDDFETAIAKNKEARFKLQGLLTDYKQSTPTPIEVPTSSMLVDLIRGVLDSHGDDCSKCVRLRKIVAAI